MRSIVSRCKKALPVRQLALQLTQGLPQKDYVGEVKRIHAFVRDRIRYVKDVRGVETVQTAVKTLEMGQGDCDDKAVLAASLLESLGHPTRFVAIGFQKGLFQHVYLDTRIGDKWLALETTEPWPLGKKAVGEVERMVVYN
jgi:transglutaminase-like putative cysteine protease